MRRQLAFEFVYQAFALVIAVIIVHSFWVAVVRPEATTAMEQERIRIAEDPAYVPERSIYVVLRDFEQESCFILMIWALAILGYKGVGIWNERKLLDLDLIRVDEGTRILPADAREYARQVQALDPDTQSKLLPRCLLAALHRFATTGNINDVSVTTQAICEKEGDRLESELSMIRYLAWAIPSIGFIGTVRGIGRALALAYQAVEGDITGVTESLGVAFNSTFVALLLSLVLMFLVHQLQLVQERLVLESESYCDDRLIQHLAVRSTG
jgi:biopolymer transport protein ExbB/TolQ